MLTANLKNIIGKNAMVIVFATCCLLQTFIFLCCDGQASWHLFLLSANICSTGLILLLPLFLLPARLRWLQIVWMLVIGAVMTANVWYLRVFEDFMSPANILLLSTVDSTVARGTIAVMRWYDFAIFLPAIICAGVYARMRDAGKRYSLRLRIAGIIICCLGCAASVFKLHRDYYLYLETRGYVHSLDDFFPIIKENMSRRQQVYVYGFAISQTIELWNTLLGATQLNDADLELIGKFANDNQATVQAAGNGKNLIVIVVESLNSTAVEWVMDNEKAMPYLNSLLTDSTAITFTNMVSIAGDARSADGQFMYHTGLFPLRGEPFVVANASGPYPSLQRQLPDAYATVEIIGEDATLWHHKETSMAYGFDRLYSDISIGHDDSDTVCQDARIFAEARQIIAGLKQPFYAMISTMTMHDPYPADQSDSSLPYVGDNMDGRDINYLESCNLFDSALSGFMSWLRDSPIWPNTVVAVVSDHEARRACLSEAMTSGNQFFALLNTGAAGTHSTGKISQIDVYPTLLEALGMKDAKWRGFGKSVLSGEATGFAVMPDCSVTGEQPDTAIVARQHKAWQLSEKWIRARNKQEALTALEQN